MWTSHVIHWLHRLATLFSWDYSQCAGFLNCSLQKQLPKLLFCITENKSNLFIKRGYFCDG